MQGQTNMTADSTRALRSGRHTPGWIPHRMSRPNSGVSRSKVGISGNQAQRSQGGTRSRGRRRGVQRARRRRPDGPRALRRAAVATRQRAEVPGLEASNEGQVLELVAEAGDEEVPGRVAEARSDEAQ
eukprot:14158533-Alexandrium_andersonii.AAC.1